MVVAVARTNRTPTRDAACVHVVWAVPVLAEVALPTRLHVVPSAEISNETGRPTGAQDEKSIATAISGIRQHDHTPCLETHGLNIFPETSVRQSESQKLGKGEPIRKLDLLQPCIVTSQGKRFLKRKSPLCNRVLAGTSGPKITRLE